MATPAAPAKPLPAACTPIYRHSPAVNKLPERQVRIVTQLIGTPRIFAQSGGIKLLATPAALFKTSEFLITSGSAHVRNSLPIGIEVIAPFSTANGTSVGADGTPVVKATFGPLEKSYVGIVETPPQFIMTREELQKRIVRNGDTAHVDSVIARYIRMNSGYLASRGIKVPNLCHDGHHHDADGDDEDDDSDDDEKMTDGKQYEVSVAVANAIEQELLKKIEAYERYAKIESRTAPLAVEVKPLSSTWQTFVDDCVKGQYGPAGEALADAPGTVYMELTYIFRDASHQALSITSSPPASSSSSSAVVPVQPSQPAQVQPQPQPQPHTTSVK